MEYEEKERRFLAFATLGFDGLGLLHSTPPMPKRAVKPEEKKSGERLAVLGFYGYLRRYGKTFYPALAALFVTAGLSLAFPFFLSQLIGGVDLSDAESLDIASVKANINQTVLILLGVLGLQAFVSYWRVRGFIKAGESALNDIRRDVFQHLIHLPIGHERLQTKDSQENQHRLVNVRLNRRNIQ